MASDKKGIFKKILGSVAPMIATAVGGPFGGLAATVMREAFGTDDDAEIEKQIAASSPDALIKLKTAEQAMNVKMKELDITEEDLFLKDRQDARSLAKVTGIWPQLGLTVFAICAFSTVLYILVVRGEVIPPENKDLVIFLIGQLSTFVGMGFSFFLGTNKSSADKTNIIAHAQPIK